MARHCVCGKPVWHRYSLCRECGKIYGFDVQEWPEWLRGYVNDVNREELEYRRHETDYLRMDEIVPNGRGGYRPKREFALRGCRTETHLYQERDQH